MELLLPTIIVFALCILGMSIGVLFGRSRIKGSCGGESHGSELVTTEGQRVDGCCGACKK